MRLVEFGIDVLLVADEYQSFERLNEIHHNVMASRLMVPESLLVSIEFLR